MKRHLVLLFSLLLIFSIALVGCGKKEEAGGQSTEGAKSTEGTQVTEEEKSSGGKTLELLMATGGTGGTYYPLGGAIASVWSKNIDNVNVTVQSTGASVENMRLLGNKETELAMAINAIAADAYNGKGKFDQPITNVRAIGVVYPEVVQIITPADSGIKTVNDLKGKRVNLGPPGSGTAVAAEQILQAYGMSTSDVEPFNDTFADAATKIKDGLLDAAFAILAVPAGNVEDIATSKDVNIVSITGDGLKKLQADHPFYAVYTIPANTYKGQTEDVQTVAEKAVMYALEDLPEDVVYNLTKLMYEKKDEIAKGHARGEQINLDSALDGVTLPLHPGAEKYYKEKGLK
ncbi:TAXI family TRAP transporter solute-binding subunit [Microaerobacter geothermalis]|uniref:TAXI family TRAP transporter solute-binding subunit n=1 Tax=Microaerobacter geothermalis TaxID=674972 RepID=UPI001F32DAA8|nr:TAXI family TRAP transporter solute-binding subunit [Microaerobacter geothermalis]MCF6094139.1 TAXI family TRAP transporter solute-binding subunit [Microaerobacter geothermalis]